VGDPCQALAHWRLGVKENAFGKEGLRGPEPGLDATVARLCSKIKIKGRTQLCCPATIIVLNHCWTTLADMSGLFECVTKLQDPPVVMMAANDLNAYRKATRRECAGN
jgi:hypothetical protein